MRFVDPNEYRKVEPIYLLMRLQKSDHSGDTKKCEHRATGEMETENIFCYELTQTLFTSAECPTNTCRGEVSRTSHSLHVLSTEPVR